MKNAEPSSCDRSCRLKRVNSSASRLTADQSHALILYKVVEASNRIRTAAHTGDHGIRQASFFF